MNKTPRIFIVGPRFGFASMFVQFGWMVVTTLEDADAVQFTGGADVDPSLYGEFPHPMTHCDYNRDEQEKIIFDKARTLGKALLGVCRGGQFLNVMNGGAMYQHVDGHTRSHEIYDVDGGEPICLATSTHHQMMVPAVKGAKVIAIANESTSRQYMVDAKVSWNEGAHDDVEVVYYDATKSLCFQPHPEMATLGGKLQRYYFKLIKDYLGIESPAGLAQEL